MESCAKKMASCADFAPIFYVNVDEEESAVESVEAVNECVQVEKALYAHGDDDEGNASTAVVHIDVGQVVNDNPIFVPDEPEKVEISLLQMENTNPNETTGDGGLEKKYNKAWIVDEKAKIISVNASPYTDEHIMTVENLFSKEDTKTQLLHQEGKSKRSLTRVNQSIVLFSKRQRQHLEVKVGGREDARFAILEGQRFHLKQDIQFIHYAYYGGSSIGSQSDFYLYNLPMVSFQHILPRLSDVIIISQVSESAHFLCNSKEYGYCMLKGSDMTSFGRYQLFEHELATAIALRHKNLLTTYGPILSECGKCIAGMLNEYMPLGCLKNMIEKAGPHLPLSVKRSILQQVATGIEYMHRAGLIHNNLQPSTILLKLSSGVTVAKVSKFANARGLINGSSISDDTIVRNMFYSDPTLDWDGDKAVHTRSSDVYSMGMVMLQTVAGEIRLPDEEQFLVCAKEAFINPFTIFQPAGITDNWWKLITSCLSLTPDERPTMHEVLETIRSFEAQDI